MGKMYFDKDVARGIDGTFMWLMEEIGELAAALRSGSPDDKMEEFADARGVAGIHDEGVDAHVLEARRPHPAEGGAAVIQVRSVGQERHLRIGKETLGGLVARVE